MLARRHPHPLAYRSWIAVVALPLAIVAASFAPRGNALTPSAAQRPTLSPGDRWTLRWTERATALDGPGRAGKTTTGTYTQVVVGRIRFHGIPAYLLRRDDGSYDIWRLDLWELARLRPSRQVGADFLLQATSPFPLHVGRKFTRRWNNTLAGYGGVFTYRVSRQERIRIPAGTFTAFRVDETGRVVYESGHARETGYSYYAPGAKRFVVQHIETDTGYRFHVEVVKYSVRP